MAKAEREAKLEAYRIFATDCLQVLTQNTGRAVPAGGRVVNARYYDWIHPERQDKRSAEEIISDIMRNAGLVQKGGEQQDGPA